MNPLSKVYRRTSLLPLALIASLSLACCSPNQPQPPEKPPPAEKVSLCQGGMVATLPLIAHLAGFFEKAGLEVTIDNKGDGKLALDALLSGACDFTTCGEPPLVQQAFRRDDYSVLATLSSNGNATRIITRSDLGVSKAADLKGKTIGVRRGTLSHFFLDLLLKRHNIAPGEVRLRFMEPGQLPDALVKGEIAAFSGTDELLLAARKKLGDRAVLLTEPGLSLAANNLVVLKRSLASRPETARKVLQALIEAESYLKSHPERAMELLKNEKGWSRRELERILADQELSVQLRSTLLISLEDHARWMLEEKVVHGEMPNLLKLIDPGPLRAVRPASVSIAAGEAP